MLKPLDQWELAQCQIMTDQYARSLKTRKKKDDVTKDDGLTFSGEVNFSGGDGGDESDFNQYNKLARAEFAIQGIKRLTLVHSVQSSLKKYILQRQSTIAANKKKKLEAEKLRQNGWQST
jgi:hypothetical protein